RAPVSSRTPLGYHTAPIARHGRRECAEVTSKPHRRRRNRPETLRQKNGVSVRRSRHSAARFVARRALESSAANDRLRSPKGRGAYRLHPISQVTGQRGGGSRERSDAESVTCYTGRSKLDGSQDAPV